MNKTVALCLSTTLVLASAAHASNAYRAPAADIPEVCKLPDPTRVSTTVSPRNPNWFFRAFPMSNKVSFASDGGNFILDMDTNKTYWMPGSYDPVPMGEDVMTTPTGTLDTFSTKQIMDTAASSETAAVTNLNSVGIGGVYQSIGLLSSGGGVSHYRAATDQDNASYIDMDVKPGTPPTVTTVGTAKKACSNQDFKLPMLSKNGQEIAGFDTTTNTTKVWKLNADGTCTEILNLGFGTGKADFSFDNKKLVFHVTGAHADEAGYFQHTSGSEARDVYVYDRESKKISKISQNTGKSAYYPVWRQDGKVIYISVDDSNNAVFVKADPALAASSTNVARMNNNCTDCATQNAPLLAIGRTWYDLCANVANANQPSAMMTALSLDKDQCIKLVTDYWATYQSRYGATITKETLLAACPTATVTNSQGTHGGIAAAAPTTGKQVAAVRCAYCHAPGRTAIYADGSNPPRQIGPWDFSNIASIPRADLNKMRTMINDGSMPQEGELIGTEKTLLVNYLRR